MNKLGAQTIVGVVGMLTLLGVCAITASATPLWGMILVIWMISEIR